MYPSQALAPQDRCSCGEYIENLRDLLLSTIPMSNSFQPDVTFFLFLPTAGMAQEIRDPKKAALLPGK